MTSELLDLCGGITANMIWLKGFSSVNSTGAKLFFVYDGFMYSVKGKEFA